MTPEEEAQLRRDEESARKVDELERSFDRSSDWEKDIFSVAATIVIAHNKWSDADFVRLLSPALRTYRMMVINRIHDILREVPEEDLKKALDIIWLISNKAHKEDAHNLHAAVKSLMPDPVPKHEPEVQSRPRNPKKGPL